MAELSPKGLQVKVFSSSVGFGRLENFINKLEKFFAGCVNLPQVGNIDFLPHVFCIFQQHLAISDDGIQERAQLMAQVGEDGPLGPIGIVSLFGCLFNILGFGLL